jgi:tetrapyrrole methylase family protein/MazG family protein
MREMDELLAVMARLRGADGCPWDAEQTLETLKTFLVEECYEVIDALDSGDAAHHREELGDLLLQIVFQSQIRSERGEFSFKDVAEVIRAKLVRRHPHVFGDVAVTGTGDVLRNWDAIKAKEKDPEKPRSAVDGVPRSMPALQRAQQIQTRAARVGFDWTDIRDVVAKVEEELAEVKTALASGNDAKISEEIGDLLFSVVNLSRFRRLQTEQVLHAAIGKFIRRFQELEAAALATGKKPVELSAAELDGLWEAVKRRERSSSPAQP